MQAMCFFAGANSIFYGEKLLTTGNPDTEQDMDLFARLGITPEGGEKNQDGNDKNSKDQPQKIKKKLYHNAAVNL